MRLPVQGRPPEGETPFPDSATPALFSRETIAAWSLTQTGKKLPTKAN